LKVMASFTEILKHGSERVSKDKNQDIIDALRMTVQKRMDKLKGKNSKKAEYYKLKAFLKDGIAEYESLSVVKDFIKNVHNFLIKDEEKGYGTVKQAFDKYIETLKNNPSELNQEAVARELAEYKELLDAYTPIINQIKKLYLDMEAEGERLAENDTYKKIEAILSGFD